MSGLSSGCLLIADIGGYSKYLSGVELEHSHDILADLLQTVVGSLCGPFELAKLEGDAVFCYQPGEPAPAAAVVGTIDATYEAFHDRLRAIRMATTCRCEACLRIPDLSLKFVVHTGDWMAHEVAGHSELVGRDIVTVHRLLKNDVAATLGIAGYALLTDACVRRHGIDPAGYGMLAHTESYDDVGEVAGAVLDLEGRRAQREGERVERVTDADGTLAFERSLPLRPAELWAWFTDPHRRPRWQQGTTDVRTVVEGDGAGRGTVNHCMHGPEVVVEEILDWKPYAYYTSGFQTPGVGPWTWTYEFTPEGGGTRVRIFIRFDGDDAQRAKRDGILAQARDMLERSVDALLAMI